MKKVFQLLKKYKGVIFYLFFGGCTTLINIAIYFLCYNIANINNIVSTLIAWVIAVVFSYITNKLFVFESKSFTHNILAKEIVSFFSCRLITGIIDVVIMWVTVDIMNMNSTLFKILSNIIVIILNYIASKLLIFRQRK